MHTLFSKVKFSESWHVEYRESYEKVLLRKTLEIEFLVGETG
jgi:hypothetical protein